MGKSDGYDLVLQDLSAEEAASLKRVLGKIEDQLYTLVLGRLKKLALLFAGIATLFGVATIATIRSAVVDAASNHIAEDSRVQNDVVSSARRRLETVDAVVADSQALDDEVRQQKAQAFAVVDDDLKQLQTMIRQLREEVAKDENKPAKS